MAEYTVKTGQNLFDVALSLYGSIEGLLDLLASNPTLSIDDNIKGGDILHYTPYYYEDSTVLQHYKEHRIVPSNQIGDIYLKNRNDLKMEIHTAGAEELGFIASGKGNLYIDWGDSSEIEQVTLSNTPQLFGHSASAEGIRERKVRLYGDFRLYDLNLSALLPMQVFVFADLTIESLNITGASKLQNIDFLSLLDAVDVMSVELVKTRLTDLSPLVRFKSAHTINLGYSNIPSSVTDRYLIGLVENYGIRRNCTINLAGSAEPSGVYQRPENLLHPSTGLEAVWVLVNEHREPGGAWKIITTNQTYTI